MGYSYQVKTFGSARENQTAEEKPGDEADLCASFSSKYQVQTHLLSPSHGGYKQV